MPERCGLGRNDATTVYCHLCDWQRPIASVSQAEHFLHWHLLEVHKKTLLYRVENDSGKRVPVQPLHQGEG